MYDAIVVGARCAGSPTAMLLARKGYRVLLVDRASFPSDTISTHIIWPHGAEIMDRWGLLDRLAATGCPPVALRMIFDVGPFALKGAVTDTNRGRGGFCPRRTVLDKLLVDAAVEAGAELREGFIGEELVWDSGQVVGLKGRTRNGGAVEERADAEQRRHRPGARNSSRAEYDTSSPRHVLLQLLQRIRCGRPRAVCPWAYQGAACFPTHDGLTLIVAVWPSARFQEIRTDIEGHVRKVHESTPSVADRLRSAKREEKWVGTAGVANYFRQPTARAGRSSAMRDTKRIQLRRRDQRRFHGRGDADHGTR